MLGNIVNYNLYYKISTHIMYDIYNTYDTPLQYSLTS